MDPELVQIGPYRLQAKLGESDLAVVYRGEDTLFERTVAVKVLHEQAAGNLAQVRRFLASGREAMRLRHHNIVRVYDVGQAEGRYYIATELVTGKSLHAELARGKGAWPAERTLALVGQVALALDYAHGLGLVHLNLKPSNILLTDDGRVLVTDFDGEASPTATDAPDHPMFARLKSPAFLAPEQARGDDQVGPAADIYSLAALTYTLCAGRAPFAGRNPLGLLRQIAETIPPRADRVAAVEPLMADAVAVALAKEPSARPPTATALVRSLVEGVSLPLPADADAGAFDEEAGEPVSIVTSGTLAADPPDQSPAHEPRRRVFTPAMRTPALALLALASLAALLMLIAAMRTAGTLMARLTNDPREDRGTVEIIPSTSSTSIALLPTVTAVGVPAKQTPGATATPTTHQESRLRARAAVETPAPVKTSLPTATSAVAAPRAQQGLMAATGDHVRMVELVTPRPTFTPLPSPTATSTPSATPTPLPTSTSLPTPTPATSLDDYALVGRIAYTQWNLHTDRPDIYIWDTKLRANGAPLPNYRQPDFGPHGLLIANAEGSGQDNLVQMGWLGENAATVSAHPEDAHPHWSPDGKQAAFDSAHMGDRQYRIYLQDDLTRRDERPPMMYLAWELFGRYPVFLSTGQIAYNGCNYWASGGDCGVYVVDTAGGMPAAATRWPSDVPTDNLGARVLLMSDRSGNWDVYSVNADGSDLRQLTSAPGNDGLATASPDGRAVAFLTDRDGRWSVYVMRPDGTDAAKLFDLPLGFGRGEYDWFQERLSWGY